MSAGAKGTKVAARPIDKRGDLISRGEVVDRVNVVVLAVNGLADDTGRHVQLLWDAHNGGAKILAELTVESEQRNTELVRRIHALEQRTLRARFARLIARFRRN